MKVSRGKPDALALLRSRSASSFVVGPPRTIRYGEPLPFGLKMCGSSVGCWAFIAFTRVSASDCRLNVYTTTRQELAGEAGVAAAVTGFAGAALWTVAPRLEA